MNKTEGFFEGWYYKLQKGDATLALIPSHHREEDGSESGCLQVITPDTSFALPFDGSLCRFSADPLVLSLDRCHFSSQGLTLSLDRNNTRLRGHVRFGSLTPIEKSRFMPDIMGPFSYFPAMQCRHDVLSMGHSLSGMLEVCGKTYDFTGGRGYLEKDAGVSFPRSWLWTQCNDFDADCSVMLASADVPFLGGSFRGLICVVQALGREYRFATYNGARLKTALCGEREAILEVARGPLALKLNVIHPAGRALLAPKNGRMDRMIREAPACKMILRLSSHGQTVLHTEGEHAGFEFVEAEKTVRRPLHRGLKA